MYKASGGEAARQIHDTLGLGDDASRLFSWLSLEYPSDMLVAANSLWLSGWFESPEVSDIVDRAYLSDPGSAPAVETVDFTGGSRDAGRAIHEWTADGTGWRIRNTFDQDGAGAYTAAVAANTIYIQAEWVTMPSGDGTVQRTFWRGSGDGVDAGFVEFRGGEFGYHEGVGGVQVIKVNLCPILPTEQIAYSDGVGPGEDGSKRHSCIWKHRSVSILVALEPDGDVGSYTLEDGLMAGAVIEWNNGMHPVVMDSVSIPAFGAKTKHDLMRSPYGMGMTDIFSTVNMPDTGAWGGLHVYESVHDAYVRFGWNGVEAAAVTLNGMEGSSHRGSGMGPDIPVAGMVGRDGYDEWGMGKEGRALTGPRHPASGQQSVQSFVADRPFLFVIQDDESGAILFMGRVTDPTS